MSDVDLPPDHTPPPGGGPTGDAMDAFGKVWRRVEKTVERYAFAFTSEYAMRAELMQAARVELLRIQASRVDVRDPQDIMDLQGRLYKHMKAVLVKHRKALPDDVSPDLRKELQDGQDESDGDEEA